MLLSKKKTVDSFKQKPHHRELLSVESFTEESSLAFDEVFGSSITDKAIYQKTTKPLVEHAFRGGNSTCFAFEQTRSGKLKTLLDSKYSLCTLATTDVLHLLKKKEFLYLSAWVSYYEVHGSYINDLLGNKKKLMAKESFAIPKLKELKLHDIDTLLNTYNYGNQKRKTTDGHGSSQSYAIVQICLKNKNRPQGKLSFIDFSGNEGNNHDKSVNQKTDIGAFEVNNGTLILEEYLRALNQHKKKIPLKGSLINVVLRNLFIGNSKIYMIATIPSDTPSNNHMLNILGHIYRAKVESRPSLSQNHANTDIRTAKSETYKPMHCKILSDPEVSQCAFFPRITKAHIKNMLKSHWTEIQEGQEYITAAKSLLSNVKKAHTFPQDLGIEYILYLQKLRALLKQKVDLVQVLQKKIKDDLCSDDEGSE